MRWCCFTLECAGTCIYIQHGVLASNQSPGNSVHQDSSYILCVKGGPVFKASLSLIQ